MEVVKIEMLDPSQVTICYRYSIAQHYSMHISCMQGGLHLRLTRPLVQVGAAKTCLLSEVVPTDVVHIYKGTFSREGTEGRPRFTCDKSQVVHSIN